MTRFILSILILFSLSGCVGPTLLFGGAAGAGVALSKEKTLGNAVDDSSLWTRIKKALLEHNKEIPGIMTDISVEVLEGRVLLTGKLDSADDRLKVLKIVWEQNGVKEVINEIKLNSQTNKTTFSQYTKDTWITTQVKAKLLANKEIRSINYNVETIDSVVYILGIARSDVELEQVRFCAEQVSGVVKFVSYVRVVGKNNKPSEDHRESEPPQRSNKNISTSKELDSYLEEPEENEEIIEIGQDSE